MDQQDLTDLNDLLDFVALGTWFAHRAHFIGVILFGDTFDAVILAACVQLWLFVIRIVGRRCFNRRVRDQNHGRVALFVVVAQINCLHASDIAGCLFFWCRDFGRISVSCWCVFFRCDFGGYDRVFGFNRRWLWLRTATTTFRLFFLGFCFGLQAFSIGFFFRDQRLTVGNRNLVIIGVDFRKGQKPVAISTVVYKCSLQGWFDTRNLSEIDVAS